MKKFGSLGLLLVIIALVCLLGAVVVVVGAIPNYAPHGFIRGELGEENLKIQGEGILRFPLLTSNGIQFLVSAFGLVDTLDQKLAMAGISICRVGFFRLDMLGGTVWGTDEKVAGVRLAVGEKWTVFRDEIFYSFTERRYKGEADAVFGKMFFMGPLLQFDGPSRKMWAIIKFEPVIPASFEVLFHGVEHPEVIVRGYMTF
ncbi:hypothetical protein A3D55_00560 [Candidatus Jorgensenbacteria bacterium RIFCSPHIGHO2_02_FULL_45_20]|uniref:Uncharacterized protein n=2 Tax=Candidatus Joergenseniibacteriota TaxID=1752739 RepID=A0A1F6BQW7_9BACT|nr:MAG: hypothetical protein UX22_C0014G0006 [Candidatus Jorgensenbacteria bacterium GW2011_GWA2_45_9]OGG39324.1 MAG: hypothetical protein A3D55_00560 [Candidatus Jorgensenbacteria bacterium RIFCSPHIGHO2_02_FULL_45_20]